LLRRSYYRTSPVAANQPHISFVWFRGCDTCGFDSAAEDLDTARSHRSTSAGRQILTLAPGYNKTLGSAFCAERSEPIRSETTTCIRWRFQFGRSSWGPL
jgi:hypothetical protein